MDGQIIKIELEKETLKQALREVLGESDFAETISKAIIGQREKVSNRPLSDREVADRLRCTPGTVQNMKKDGRLKTVIVRGRRKVLECDLLKYQGVLTESD